MGRQAPSSGFPCKVLQGFFLVLLDLSLWAGVSGTLRGQARSRNLTFYFRDALFGFTNVFCDRGDFGCWGSSWGSLWVFSVRAGLRAVRVFLLLAFEFTNIFCDRGDFGCWGSGWGSLWVFSVRAVLRVAGVFFLLAFIVLCCARDSVSCISSLPGVAKGVLISLSACCSGSWLVSFTGTTSWRSLSV